MEDDDEDYTYDSYYKDVYSNPKRHGLVIREVTNCNNNGCNDYSFHILVAWDTLDGKESYWGEDSGCSCPSPFEDVYSVDSLSNMRFTESEYKQRLRVFRQPRGCRTGDDD